MIPVILIPGKEADFINYKEAVEAAGGRAVFTAEAVISPCDGILLPGGGDVEPWRYGQTDHGSRGMDAARDALELNLLDQVSRETPVLGICRGMQVLNVYFGGTLIQDLPGHSTCSGIDRLHRVHTAPSFLSQLYGDGTIINSAHHQAADRLGSGLSAVQWAPDGTVEAVCHQRRPVWGVQWHPERLCGRFAKGGAVNGGKLLADFVARCGR